MRLLLLSLSSLLLPSYAFAESWFSGIDYQLGGAIQVGVMHSHQATAPLGEFAALELRAIFPSETSWTVETQSTFNLSRMVLRSIQAERVVFDYDLHVGFRKALANDKSWVLAPGANLTYAPGKLGQLQVTGGFRAGADFLTSPTGSMGVYIRPFVGWSRYFEGEVPQPSLTYGGFLEFVYLWTL